MARPEILAAIDFGARRIRAAIAEKKSDGLELIGFAQKESAGMEKGVIDDIDILTERTFEVLDDAMQGVRGEISYVILGLAAQVVSHKRSWGMIPVWNRRIKNSDRLKAVSIAAAVPLSPVQSVAQYVVLDYFVDEIQGIKNPLNLRGVKFGAECLVVIANRTEVDALAECMNRLGRNWCGFVFEPMAAAKVVLNDEEKRQGVILIDLGATQSSFVVYQDFIPSALGVVAIGGFDITKQIAQELNIPIREAERIKSELPDLYIPDPNDKVELELFGGIKGIPWQVIAQIMREQYELIFNYVTEMVSCQGVQLDTLSSAVLVGGGAKASSIEKLARKFLPCPVRVASAHGPGSQGLLAKGAEYATIFGLLQWAAEDGFEGLTVRNGIAGRFRNVANRLFRKKFKRGGA